MFSLATVAAAQMHGYVEPCAPAFVEDHSTTCEACPLSHDPEQCRTRLREQGYVKKCQTGGHSAPSELWCKDKHEPARGSLTYLTVLVGLSAFMGLFWFWKGRRGSRSRTA